MTEHTINLTPVMNEERVREYAAKHNTTRPYDHVTGQLAALGGLADEMRDLEDRLAGDELAWAFVRAFENMHRQVSTEFARFFGGRSEQ